MSGEQVEDLRDVLGWYQRRGCGVLVTTGRFTPTAAGRVAMLGEGFVLIAGGVSDTNVPLGRVLAVRPQHDAPMDAPCWTGEVS